MKKLAFALFTLISFATVSNAQQETYGPYYGGNAFVYKSNLFNSDDLHSDSVQKYKMTFGFGAGFDFGRKYENGVSISSGISFGTCNQNYAKNSITPGDELTFSANTKMSFVKIPLTVSMQTKNTGKLKLFYSVGLFYSYNSGYSETIKYDYKYAPDVTVKISKKTTTTTTEIDPKNIFTANTNLDKRPYRRHGVGSLVAFGVSKRINQQNEAFVQAKIEYQLSSSEYTGETLFTPYGSTSGSIDAYKAHVWGNYSKYVHADKQNYDRAATHPFNLGITFGIRHYIFTFEH